MKLKKVGKSFLGSFLAICMIVAGMSTMVFADDPAAIQDTYEVDGVNYYKVNTNQFGTSSKNFFQDLLSTNSSVIGNKSAAEQWKSLGFKVWEKMTELSSNCKKYMKKGANGESGKDDTHMYNFGNLASSDGMKSAEDKILTQLAAYMKSSFGFDAFSKDKLLENAPYKDDTSTGLVYALPIYYGYFGTNNSIQITHESDAFVAYFSDFQVTPLLPEDKGTNYLTTTVRDVASEGDSYASTIKNNTAIQTNASQTLSVSNTASVQNEINGSSSYTLGTTITVGIEKEFLETVKATLQTENTFSQEVQRGWTSTTANENTKNIERSVGVDLPAYTGVMLKSSSREQELLTKYNCPIAITYRVRIVQYNSTYVGNSGYSSKTKIITDFTNDSRANLKQRAILEKNHILTDGINWADFDNDAEMQTLIGYMSSCVPMASTQAQFTEKLKTVENVVDGLMPILPLRVIEMPSQDDEITLKPGESFRVDNIALEGLNDKNTTYYGFDKKYGHWIIMDENGNELTDGSIASLEKQSALNREVLTANALGTVYLKYVIDEDRYGIWGDTNYFTKNSELEKSAIIEVNITEKGSDNGGQNNNNNSNNSNVKTVKKANTLAISGKKVKVKYKKLKKKAKKIKAVKFKNKGQGPLTYIITGVNKAKFKKFFKINKTTGKITIKKKLKKGTYKVKVAVSAAGNNYYKSSGFKQVTVKIKVK